MNISKLTTEIMKKYYFKIDEPEMYIEVELSHSNGVIHSNVQGYGKYDRIIPISMKEYEASGDTLEEMYDNTFKKIVEELPALLNAYYESKKVFLRF